MDHLLYGLSHLQAEKLELGLVSTVAAALCPAHCGYQEYRYLMQHPEVHKIAARIEEQLSKLVAQDRSAILDRNKLSTLDWSAMQQRGIHQQALPEPLPAYQNDTLTEYHYFSGRSDRYLSPLLDRNVSPTAQRMIQENMGDIFNNNPELSELFSQQRDAFMAQFRARLPWPEYRQQLVAYIKSQREVEPRLAPVWNKIDEGIALVDSYHQSFRQNQRQPFAALTNRDLTGDMVISHWIRYAHQHAPQFEDYNQLFSTNLKSKIAEQPEANASTLYNINTLIAVYPRLRGSDGTGTARLRFEYMDAFSRVGDQLWLSNGIDHIVFLYENGAWRLDQICRIAADSYQLCPIIPAETISST
ncbi:hypothetical protein QWY20_12420 [Alkalimonas sp. MEB108]|uniref:Uncharacterized protein n=1 Tax=Alkalimonas cellulosilytica TaxID=3058395 RepID=A0ABU7J6W3_9GAMM|nr:hypothetical protein [Alkalimonas sp. MEB108]MEE2002260.1 hypothetical protein [Alkalimonas sp. MEB108]